MNLVEQVDVDELRKPNLYSTSYLEQIETFKSYREFRAFAVPEILLQRAPNLPDW
jgi:hypothetical protein